MKIIIYFLLSYADDFIYFFDNIVISIIYVREYCYLR